MIVSKRGDLFLEDCEVIVNPVNCVGVMGGGLAYEFKRLFPGNYLSYKKSCDSKELIPGKLHITQVSDLPRKFIVNFPTKNHYIHDSKIEYIESGLNELVAFICEYNIKSISIPALGCGLGNLNWENVKSIIHNKLSDLSSVNIILFEPL